MYAKLFTRFGIFCCEYYKQILVKSRLEALDCCKNIPKYLGSTKGLFFIFKKGLELRVGGYTDVDGRMSISACILKLCWFDMMKGSKQSTNGS